MRAARLRGPGPFLPCLVAAGMVLGLLLAASPSAACTLPPLPPGAAPRPLFRLERVTSVRPLDGGRDVTIRGALTLHGVTRELAVPVRVREDGALVRLEGERPLRMSDYGIPIPTFLFLAVEDQVTMRFQVTARREP